MDWFKVDELRLALGRMRLGLRTVRGAGLRWSVLTWVLIGLNGLVPVGRTFVMANMVASVPGVIRDGVDSPAADRFVVWAWAFVAILTVNGFIGPLVRASAERLARQVDGLLRERVMKAALGPVRTEFLVDPSVREPFAAARTAAPVTGLTPGRLANLLPNVVGGRVLVVGMVAGVTYVDWRLGLDFGLLHLKTQDEMQKALWRLASGGGAAAPGLTDYQLELASTARAAKEIRVFGLKEWILERYRHGMDTHMRGIWASRQDFTPGLIVLLGLTAVLNVVALITLGYAAIDGDVSLAELTFALAAIMSLNPGGALNPDDIPMAFISDTVTKIESAEALLAERSGHPGDQAPPAAPRTIRFEGVSFRYPGGESDVLRDLDLELRTGERTALVGANGAGKTTLVKLLSGLYQPTGGRILVDGVGLEQIDAVAWRQRLSVLFQDFLRYELTATDNIRYGAVHWEPTDLADQVAEVSELTGIRSHVEALGAGWDSPLTPGFAEGTALSGGEWQRVGLARTLFGVRAGADALVLDEPTASLDVRGEAELFDLLVRLTAPGADGDGLLTLFVSHRFSTVRQADRIVVLDEGRIVEDGSHDELVAASGLYARMFRTQADQYAAAAGASGVDVAQAEEEV